MATRTFFPIAVLVAAAWTQVASAVITNRVDCGVEKHWSFVAPELPSIPHVKNKRWARNPIDAFVLARLEQEGIAPSPEADRRTLIRRLSLDLIGLPPTPDQVRDFVADTRPDAYEQLVDALLDSPHFGERWARHWLDLARYADTSGYQIDRPRPYAYLFRDWVIDAINDDMPFDQFTVEQLAGDLLPNATLEQKTAAGFHRLTLSNHEDGVDAEEFRAKAKVDRVSTTGTVWLGLTVGCAECHNHKYDPISQREFYQFYAFFNNADEVEVPAPQANDPARLEREKKSWEAEQTRLKGQLAELARGKDVRAVEVKRMLARHRRAQPKPMEAAAMSFREGTNAPRANVHIRGDFLRKGDPVCAGTPAVLNAFAPRDTVGQTSRLSCKPAVSDPAASSINPNHLNTAKGAGEMPALRWADRLDLADWIVDPANPLAARVAVNNVWLHLFGRGLVATTEDFGTRGERPSHPELLDWLAVAFFTDARPLFGPEFEGGVGATPHPGPLSLRGGEGGATARLEDLKRDSTPPVAANSLPLLGERVGVRAGHLQTSAMNSSELSQSLLTSVVTGMSWSRKALIKLIVTSATYRQSSHARPELAARDPLNVLLARQSRLRLESEAVRDTYLAVSGLLNLEIGGPSFRPHMSDDVKKLGTAGAFSWTDSEGPEKYRRGLYIFAQRTVPYPTAMTFDQADPTQTCTRRERSNTPLQALTLLNHGLFVECALNLAGRIREMPSAYPRDRIEQGFEVCLARKPSRAELDRLVALYHEQVTMANRGRDASTDAAGSETDTSALIALSQVLLNLDEFLTRE